MPLSGTHEMDLPCRNGIERIHPRSGDCVWMPEGTWNHPTWIPSVKTITFIFRSDYLQTNLVHSDANPGIIKRQQIVDELPPGHTLQPLIAIIEQKMWSQDVLLSLIQAFIYTCLDWYEQERGHGAASLSYQQYHKVATWVQEHALNNCSREQAAIACGISPAHISRLYQQHSTISFAAHVTQERLNHANLLLRESSHTIQTIGRLCGYDDCNYFIRVFKQHRQCTPKQWRQNL